MKGAGPRLCLNAAVSENMGIGKNNTLPWRLKSEIKHFAHMTKTTADPNKKEHCRNSALFSKDSFLYISGNMVPPLGMII
jgi:dihydrofolate reductase